MPARMPWPSAAAGPWSTAACPKTISFSRTPSSAWAAEKTVASAQAATIPGARSGCTNITMSPLRDTASVPDLRKEFVNFGKLTRPAKTKCPAQGRAFRMVGWIVRSRRRATRGALRPLLRRLDWILHVLEGGELDIVEFAVLALDLADVDVLHDVSLLRIDRDRSARAFPFQPLHGLDQYVTIGLAVGLLERLVDHVHAVIAPERDEVRPHTVELLERLHVGLVHRRRVIGGIIAGRDGAEDGVVHARQVVVIRDVARPDQLDAGLVE